jgi:glycerol-3-phosphate acyltransferase PlsY
VVAAVLLVAGGYVLGSLPTALAVGRRTGHDPTSEGSGNPGATNVYRTAGRRAGAFVLLGDVVKGAAAAGLGWWSGGHLLGVACAAAAVVGHVLPVTRGFRGGKGVATYGGAVLVLFPLHGVVAAAAFLAAAKLSRRVSVASLVIAVAIPLGVAATGAPATEVALLAAIALLVVVRHADNIARLARGAERPLEAGQR